MTEDEKKEKHRARRKVYRERHREKLKARERAYRKANSEKIKTRQRAWRQANPEKQRVWGKIWREANRGYQKVWRQANLERARSSSRASVRAWRQRHPEKEKASAQKWRRANHEKLKDYFKSNQEAWKRLLKAEGMDRCQKCGSSNGKIHLHHVDSARKKWAISDKSYGPITEEKLAELNKCVPLCPACHLKGHVEMRKRGRPNGATKAQNLKGEDHEKDHRRQAVRHGNGGTCGRVGQRALWE